MSVAETLAARTTTTCASCGTTVSATLLSCPACHRLVHAAELKDLAARATAAEESGDAQSALVAWRTSLTLLPPDARQSAAIAVKIANLSRLVESAPQPTPEVPRSGAWKWLAALGPAGLLLWKFKFVVVAILSKGKVLLLGLTKIGTLASMFAMVGVYWSVWGLWFALGLVISIYVHEMGHVYALRRYGIAASAPMFIPGVGALVRLKQTPVNGREDARIGLAGPVWGLGAAIAAAAAGLAGAGPMWLAIAHTGAWINLFNLMPIWPLDGGRAFQSIARGDRWIAAAALAAAWALTRDGVVMLVLLVAIWRAFATRSDIPADRGALGIYACVALSLSVVFQLTGGITRGALP